LAKSPQFTARFIDKAPAPDIGRVEYWDGNTPGFGIRVSASGRKSWILVYRFAGQPKRLTFGTYPAVPLAAARESAKEALYLVSKGTDPAALKQADRRGETFRDVAEEYLERHARAKKKSWRKDKLALDRDLLPELGKRKAKDIARRDVNRILDNIVARGAPIQANRTLEILRKIYNWAIARELVTINPCHMISPPAPARSRQRVLSNDEIRKLWHVLEEDGSSIAVMFKLRLLTLQRGGEICRMRRRDLDFVDNWWTIPPEFAKNGLAHRVPLTRVAAEVISRQLALSQQQWVFPSPTRDAPIKSIWKATSRIRATVGLEFTPHDLRRTGASHLASLGISRLVIAKILNHVETDVTAVYDRHSYDAEKRLALDIWTEKLATIVGSNGEGVRDPNAERP
jgi:integrase